MPEYRQSAGGMWSRKDRNGRVYYFVNAHAEGKEYKFHAFVNPKKQGKQPDFTLYALDDGVGVPVRFTPRPSRSSEEEQAPYKGQAAGSSPAGAMKDHVGSDQPEWPDNDADEDGGSDDERLEDGGSKVDAEEDDGLPY